MPPPNQNQQRDQLPPPSVQDIDEKILQENLQIKAAQRSSYVARLNPARRLGLLAMQHRFVSLLVLLAVLVGVPVTIRLVSDGSGAKSGQQNPSSGIPDVVDFPTNGADQQTNSIAGSADNSGSGDMSASGAAAGNPTTPSGLKASFAATSVAVTWSKASAATQYTVEIATNSGFTGQTSIISGTTSAFISGLSPKTTYYIRVRAVGSSDTSAWSKAVSGKTTSLPPSVANEPYPAQVSGVAVKVNSSQSVTVSWGAAAHASRYSVTRALNSSLTSGKKEYASVSGTSYTVSDLSPGTVYYFVVQASNSRGLGSKSSPVAAKTHMLVPSLSSIAILSASSLKITWQGVTGATKYTLQYSSSSTMSGAASTTVSGSSISLGALHSGTYYYIRVRATDGHYTTGWSSIHKARTAIAVPTGLKSSSVTYKSAKMSWTASHGASGYTLRYSTHSSMSSSTSKVLSGTSLSLSLKARTQYYAQVSARDGTKSTAWSKIISFKTDNPPTAVAHIISYNTHYSTATSDVVSDVKRLISDGGDIVSLQEMNYSSHRQAVKSHVSSCASCHFGMYIPSNGIAAQNLVLWDKNKYSLQGSGIIKAAGESVVEGTTYHGMYITYVKLRVRTNGRIVYVMSAHLPAHVEVSGSPRPDYPKRLAVYKKAMSAIKSKISAVRASDVSVFVTGDFNVDYRADARVRYSGFPYVSFGNVSTYASYRLLGPPSGGTHAGNRLIDYVFLAKNSKTSAVSQRIIGSGLHSDHKAIMAKFNIKY